MEYCEMDQIENFCMKSSEIIETTEKSFEAVQKKKGRIRT